MLGAGLFSDRYRLQHDRGVRLRLARLRDDDRLLRLHMQRRGVKAEAEIGELLHHVCVRLADGCRVPSGVPTILAHHHAVEQLDSRVLQQDAFLDHAVVLLDR